MPRYENIKRAESQPVMDATVCSAAHSLVQMRIKNISPFCVYPSRTVKVSRSAIIE